MARKQPEQSPNHREKKLSALARQIRKDLKRLNMSQKDLAVRSGLPESRISRILNDGNVNITEQDINLIAIGLHKSRAERDELRYLAWPALKHIDEALQHGESVVELNCRLHEAGLPLIGYDNQES